MRILSIGEVLWDIIGGHEYLGGAPLNFSAHSAQLGHEVKFLSAVGRDTRGETARHRIEQMRIETELLATKDQAATGVSEVTLNASGAGEHRLPRPAAYDYLSLSDSQLKDVQAWVPSWIYFGTLALLREEPRAIVAKACETNPAAERFYDLNLRPKNYTAEAVQALLKLATVLKLNEEEVGPVAAMAGVTESSDGPDRAFCKALADEHDLKAVCVTLGGNGSLLYRRDPEAFVRSPGYRVTVADTVGAGDAFSATFVHGWSAGWELEKIGDVANRVGALVASRSGAIPYWTMEEACALT